MKSYERIEVNDTPVFVFIWETKWKLLNIVVNPNQKQKNLQAKENNNEIGFSMQLNNSKRWEKMFIILKAFKCEGL